MGPRVRFGPVLAAFLGLAITTPAVAQQYGKPIVVFRPNSDPYGKSFSEWSAEWWKWAYSLPVDRNPLFDETGELAAEGQSGPVFYLAGVFNVTGTAVRSVTIPPGKALLFPILNVEWDNLCPPVDPPMDEAQLLAKVNENLDQVSELSCEVNGTSIPGLETYRVTSPTFSVTFPDNNLFQLFGCDVPAGTYDGFVSGGYYLMLAPLKKGLHTVHFRGSVGSPPVFTLDITYHIRVADPSSIIESPLLASVAPNPLNPEAILTYRTSRAGPVTVTLYDLSGRLVRTLVRSPMEEAGQHTATIDGRDALGRKLSSGVYFYRIVAAEGEVAGRFTILK